MAIILYGTMRITMSRYVQYMFNFILKYYVKLSCRYTQLYTGKREDVTTYKRCLKKCTVIFQAKSKIKSENGTFLDTTPKVTLFTVFSRQINYSVVYRKKIKLVCQISIFRGQSFPNASQLLSIY